MLSGVDIPGSAKMGFDHSVIQYSLTWVCYSCAFSFFLLLDNNCILISTIEFRAEVKPHPLKQSSGT